MGSDFSFEDEMKNEKLSELYSVTLTGTEKFENTDCYMLELKARTKEAPYDAQKIWVGKNDFVPYKLEYFAISGILLKSLVILETEKIGNRNFPVKLKMVNELKKKIITLFLNFQNLKSMPPFRRIYLQSRT